MPLLWKSKDCPFYLCGSIHVGPPGGFELPETVLDAITGAENVIFEIDPARLSIDPKVLERIAGSLKEDLGESTYQRLRVSTLYDESFENVCPGIILPKIASSVFTGIGMTAEFGLDKQIERIATGQGKPLGGLETVMDQLTPLLNMDAATASQCLTQILDHPETLTDARDRILWSFINGTHDDLAFTRARAFEQTPIQSRMLFTDRESRWLPSVLQLARSGKPVFMLVGCLHLVGPGNLVEALRSQGVPLEEVP